MKAALMRSPGDPSVLQIERVPVPSCEKANQVLVKLKAAGVNPIDTKLRRRGSFYPAEMPCILGCDGAGVVVETGKGVTHFQVGDEVYFCAGGLGATSTGNYAEWAVVPEHQLAPKPQNLSFAMAAAAPLVLITAWEALYDRGYLQGEQTVLIMGGAGGVGHGA
ncbi:MAG: alcohol dehydrogenase catalytic domain-containing protein, partial [Cyanobacteria bacterium P01_H01_bin.15]